MLACWYAHSLPNIDVPPCAVSDIDASIHLSSGAHLSTMWRAVVRLFRGQQQHRA